MKKADDIEETKSEGSGSVDSDYFSVDSDDRPTLTTELPPMIHTNSEEKDPETPTSPMSPDAA